MRASSGDAAGAQAAFSRALEIAPDYDDAKFGLAQLAYRSGDLEGARSWLQRIRATRRDDPEIVALSRSVAAAGRGAWRMDASASYSTLTDGLAPWREASWSLSHRNRVGWFGGGVEYARRFDRSDLFGELRFTRPVGQGSWGLAFGGASDPSFKPEAALRAEVATDGAADWTFDGSMTLARYSVGEIDRVGLRATHRLNEYLRAIAQAVVVHDELGAVRNGYAVGASWRRNERMELSVNWSDAPESSEGVTIDVRSLAIGIAAEIRPDLRVRLGVAREERDAFDRMEVSIAIARTF